MGAGLAMEFKRRYSAQYLTDYKIKCHRGILVPGKPSYFDEVCHWVCNFPTKNHYREPSKIEYIRKGLLQFSVDINAMGFKEVSMPALGCGLGGLDWRDVRPLLEAHLGHLEIIVNVWEPQ
jgi:O-acetyl-ADP-ribose deacetylase (regulator of RNase III)